MTPQLYIMLKEPRPGRVKTRLGRDIGMVPAAWWFRHQTRALIQRVGYDPRWQTVLAVSPDMEGSKSRIWPADLPRWPQGSGDLGGRMGRILRRAPHGPVVIIGADVPGITRTLIAAAFWELGRHDAVFGPAPDGGYWLVGLKRVRGVPAKLFDGVRWSTGRALADTLKTLPDHSVGRLPVLRDVDTVADLA
ncbi:MAG: glycosyltransferase [Rhodobacteraceae bacterium]|nr:glycosyltransferase [Paracoccaceae bacterium]